MRIEMPESLADCDDAALRELGRALDDGYLSVRMEQRRRAGGVVQVKSEQSSSIVKMLLRTNGRSHSRLALILAVTFTLAMNASSIISFVTAAAAEIQKAKESLAAPQKATP